MNIINFNKDIINKIQAYQKKSGRFKVSIIDNNLNILGDSPSIFTTSIILGNLSISNKIENYGFLKKASGFLVNQGLRKHSWNYWDKNSDNYKEIPYPDDLDDSSLAIFAICNYDNLDKHTELLKKSIRKIESKKDPKLGYATWFVPQNSDEHWTDFDPVVNSNIILLREYLGLEVDSNIIEYLYTGLEKNTLQSKYYFNNSHIAYFVVRMRQGYANETVKKRLISNIDDENDVMTLSMILSTLTRLNCEEKILTLIYKKIINLKNNWSDIYPLHIESIKNGIIYYAGSEALTLSFVFEALNLYKNYIEEVFKRDEINDKLIKTSLKGIDCNVRVYSLLIESMQYILKWKSVRRIIFLPHQINKTTGKSNLLTDKTLAIGLLGWVAYTIDDHIKDGDKEINKKWVSISISNILKNKMYQLITEISNYKTRLLVYKIITEMEAYSALEETEIKLNYKKMEHSMKSLGVAVPTVLLMADDRKNSQILSSFKHYVSARQISDDATDWKEDLKKGKSTCITTKFSSRKKRKSFEKDFFPKITNQIKKECYKSIGLSLKIFSDTENPLANLSYEYIRAARRELAQKVIN